MEELQQQLAETTAVIRQRWQGKPRVGIILGTGLGKLVEQVSAAVEFRFEELPHFRRSTALGHAGRLVCGKLCDLEVIVMRGRLHAYEGYSTQEITYPVRVMRALGVDRLIVTSASGGMNPLHKAGQLMVIDDHINLMGDNPLIGANVESFGPRFPDMSQPYDPEWIELALQVARERKIPLLRGVYVGVKGPNYETRAEYRFFRMIGGDVVGMSTVPEVLVAVHAGMRVLGLTTITNVCLPDNLRPVTGEEVIHVADRASRDLLHILEDVLKRESRKIHEELFQ